jgi:hypothetical protein
LNIEIRQESVERLTDYCEVPMPIIVDQRLDL